MTDEWVLRILYLIGVAGSVMLGVVIWIFFVIEPRLRKLELAASPPVAGTPLNSRAKVDIDK